MSSSDSPSADEEPFTFVLLPADDSLPARELTADARGGFEDDALKRVARAHLFAPSPDAAASPAAVAAAREQLAAAFDHVIEVPYLRYKCKPLRTAKQREMYGRVELRV